MKNSLSLLDAMVAAEGWPGTEAELIKLCKIKVQSDGFGTWDDWEGYGIGDAGDFNDWLENVYSLLEATNGPL